MSSTYFRQHFVVRRVFVGRLSASNINICIVLLCIRSSAYWTFGCLFEMFIIVVCLILVVYLYTALCVAFVKSTQDNDWHLCLGQLEAVVAWKRCLEGILSHTQSGPSEEYHESDRIVSFQSTAIGAHQIDCRHEQIWDCDLICMWLWCPIANTRAHHWVLSSQVPRRWAPQASFSWWRRRCMAGWLERECLTTSGIHLVLMHALFLLATNTCWLLMCSPLSKIILTIKKYNFYKWIIQNNLNRLSSEILQYTY